MFCFSFHIFFFTIFPKIAFIQYLSVRLELGSRLFFKSVLYSIKIISLINNSHGNGATARVVLFDFRKAFDLIDHNILVQKLSTYDLPKRILCWIVDFLMDRKQRVKLAQDCFSEWRSVVAGVPQGTKLGPWLYLIMHDQ